MSISSGYDKFKDYHQTEDGSYKLTSRWTSSNTVELDDGSTAEEKITEIDNKFKNQDNSINNINTRLNGLVDSNGRFRQIVMVDAVTGTDYVLKMRKGEWVSYISVPGLYDKNGNLLISWADLTSMDYCTLTNDCCIEPQAILTVDENGVLNSANDRENCCCENLSSDYLQGHLVIPNSVTSIGDSAFAYCTALTSVTIPDSVTSIGDVAFDGCTGLTSITIPDNVTSIGISTFADCDALTSITIPDSVTSIGDSAFFDCAGLTSITIPDSVTSIGYSAFYGCAGLTSITIPDNVTSIGYGTFCRCTGLTSITIPDSITSIGNDAFNGCTGLTSVTIPDSVTSIGNGAFEDCDALTSVYFEHTTTPTFKNYCFYKSSGNMCTFYFKNSTVANVFTTSYYNSSYGTKSTDYDW